MEKSDFVLGCLSVAIQTPISPVQVQKMFFLIDQNLSELMGGPFFDFQPYHYGPFDKNVYELLEALSVEGLVEIIPDHNWKSYKLTEKGLEKGLILFEKMPDNARSYIKNVSDFVRRLSFTELVTAIYKAYPEMRKNSVFQG